MLIEAFLLLSLFAGILVFFSEASRLPILGMIAAVVLVVLGSWVAGSGLQMKTGEISTISSSIAADSTNTTSSMSYNYTEVPATPFFTIQGFIVILYFLLAIYEGGISITRVWGAH